MCVRLCVVSFTSREGMYVRIGSMIEKKHFEGDKHSKIEGQIKREIRVGIIKVDFLAGVGRDRGE